MRKALAAVLFMSVSMIAAAQVSMKVGALAFEPATKLAEIDTDKIKGQPSKLAWSPDGAELYVQMLDGHFGVPGGKFSHHVYKVDGGKHEQAPAEPEWVTDYWTAKSGQASPDAATFKIALNEETRNQKTTSVPMGGDLARGGTSSGTGGATPNDVAAAYGQQAVKVVSMLLNGQVIGEYINAPIVPGQTFGWGPKGSKVVAYSHPKSGRVIVMDDEGKRQEIDGTKDAMFPAWSADGTHLAWLQKDGRKKYILQVSRVSQR